MISFTLSCPEQHRFESWFKSSGDYLSLREAGHVACPVCGSVEIEKSMMAPAIATSKQSLPVDPAMLRKIHDHVVANTDDVGDRFAQEARAIHLGDKPQRAIRGKASTDEVRDLHEDGIAAIPIPVAPPEAVN